MVSLRDAFLLPCGDEDLIGYPCDLLDCGGIGIVPNSSSDSDCSTTAMSPPSSTKHLSAATDCSGRGGEEVVEGENSLILSKRIQQAEVVVHPPIAQLPQEPRPPHQAAKEDLFQAGFEKLFGLSELNPKMITNKQLEIPKNTAVENILKNQHEYNLSSTSTSEESTSEESASSLSDQKKETANHRGKVRIFGPNQKESPDEGPSEVKEEKTPAQEESQQSAFPTILGRLQFEVEFVGLASTTLILYCMAHMTIYELIYALVLEITDMRFHNLTLLYGGLLTCGIALLRCTGFLWYFLTSKRYRQTKAERKKRRGCWDVRLYNWLEDRTYLTTALEVVGFYLCYISLAFFWNKFLTMVVDQKEAIYERLPSAKYRQDTLLNGATSSMEGSCQPPSKNWDLEDYEFLYKTVAKTTYYQYSGNVEAPLYSAPVGMLVYSCAAGLAMYVLSKIGPSFVDTW